MMKRTGDDYLDSREFHHILSAYERAAKSGDGLYIDVDDMMDIAEYYQLTGDIEKAWDIVNTSIDRYPGATMPLVFKARQCLANGDTKEAKKYIDRITDKDDTECVYLSAELMLAKGEEKKADTFLKKYVEQQDEDEKDGMILECAGIFADHGAFDTAQEWLDLSNLNDDEDYKELRARLLLVNGKYDDSIDIFNEIIDKNPFSKQRWQALADAQYLSEKYDDALASVGYALAIDPNDPESIIAKAHIMFHLKKFEESLDYYRRYNEKRPDDEFGLLNEGYALMGLDRPQEALEVLKKALAVGEPTSQHKASIYHEMAYAYAAMKDYDMAIKCINKTKKLDCNHAAMAVTHGHFLLMSGQTEASKKVFMHALDISEDAPHTLLQIVLSLHDNGFVETAYKLYHKFLEIDIYKTDEGYAFMALCCNDLKRTEEFLHYLKIACERNPHEAQIMLGCLFPEDIPPAEYYEFARGIWGDKITEKQ